MKKIDYLVFMIYKLLAWLYQMNSKPTVLSRSD